jgi:heme-degrading monooxygenase HmoA
MQKAAKDAVCAVIWEFQVKGGSEARFEQFYGPHGDWVRLFELGKGYRGTVLLRDAENKRRYLTLDFWASQAASKTFRRRHSKPYRTLERQGELLTERETPLGSFTSLDW